MEHMFQELLQATTLKKYPIVAGRLNNMTNILLEFYWDRA